VILRPHRRKRNQRIMNRRQSTSISRKREPENFIYSGAWHSSSVPPVCTENLIRIDLMRESLNVGRPD
jgi:hypothetical protein